MESDHKKKCYQYSVDNMKKAIQCVTDNEMSTRQACKVFSVPRSSLQRRLNGLYSVDARSGRKPTLSKEQETKLVDYACNRASLGIGFGKSQFLKYAGAVAKKHNTEFKKGTPTDKWWRGMKKRNGTFTRRTPEGTSSIRNKFMNRPLVKKYFSALEDVLKEHKFESRHIWNMDETGVQLEHVPRKIIARKGSKHVISRTSGNRETITIIGAVNASGKSAPPHLILKGKTKRALNGFDFETAPEGTTVSVSDKGWTKRGIAELWFENSFLKAIGPDRPQLLIFDGHDSHNFVELIEKAMEEGIVFVELPAHTSHWLQPLDRAVFSSFKTAWGDVCQQMMSDFPGVVVNHGSFCGLLAKAWHKSVTEKNVQSGFRACGIHPFNPAAIPDVAFLPNSIYSFQIPESTETNEEKPEENANPPIEEARRSNEGLDIVLDDFNPSGSKASQALPLRVGQGLTQANMESLLFDSPSKMEEDDDAQMFADDQSRLNNIKQEEEREEEGGARVSYDCPSSLALYALEKALSKTQLQEYQHCYMTRQQPSKANERLYTTWKNYKEKQRMSTSQDNPLPGQSKEIQTSSVNTPKEPSSIRRPLFPIQNSSSPDDADSDVLPYPTALVTSQKSNKKPQTKYFVLTQRQVIEEKRATIGKKEEVARKKEEAAKKREAARKKKEEEAMKKAKVKTLKKDKENQRKSGNKKM